MSRIDSILSGSLIFRDQGTYLSEIRPGVDKVTITGSLHITGSNILLNGSDIGLRITTLEAGQGADQVKFGSILLYTASLSEWTASLKDYTSSLATTASNHFIGSQYVTGSIIPQGTADLNGIYDLGSVSAPFRDLYLSTASLHFVKDGNTVVNVTGEDRGVVVGNLLLGTSSISIIDNQGEIVDVIYQATLDPSGNLIEVEQQSLPQGIVSSSAQIDALGFLSASISGIVSRSAQISELGFITGSKFYELDDIPQGIVSGTVQIQDYLLDNDLNLGSGSILADNITISGSITIDGQDINAELEKLKVFGLSGSYGSANTDIQVTGSFNLSLDGISKYFSIDVNGEEKVKVNEEGVFQLISQSSSPTPVEGGIYFGDDFNLYLGVNE